MFDCLSEKRLGRGHVAPGAEQEVHGLPRPIHRSIKVDPFAADLQVGLVDTSRPSRGHAQTVQAFDELRRITLHPTQNRRVSQRQTPLGHHLDQVAQAELLG